MLTQSGIQSLASHFKTNNEPEPIILLSEEAKRMKWVISHEMKEIKEKQHQVNESDQERLKDIIEERDDEILPSPISNLVKANTCMYTLTNDHHL